MIINREECLTTVGGAGLTAALLHACNTIYKTLYGFGENLGASIRRLIKGC